MTIDAALRMQPDSFDALMQLLEEAGCRVKRGAQISIKPPGGENALSGWIQLELNTQKKYYA